MPPKKKTQLKKILMKKNAVVMATIMVIAIATMMIAIATAIIITNKEINYGY
ncbi:unknown [Bacteroides intestinalis CAG:564]|nr:unknown [Bacteroides intestinalis CAG:564]